MILFLRSSMICSKCKRTITKYPCPHCGHDDRPMGASGEHVKEGGSGGPQPSDD